jgi:hypothetical protein
MLRFLLFIAIMVPFGVNAYSITGSADRVVDGFPMVYFNWSISVAVDNDQNPCYRLYNCYIVYGELFSENNFSTYIRYPTDKIASGYPELGMFLPNRSFGLSGKKYNVDTATVPDGKKYPCVNLGYQIGYGAPTPINPLECMRGGGSTPPPITCEVNSAAIALQHAALADNELNGSRKEVNINVSCSSSSSVSLRITGLNANGRLTLAPNGGLYSELTINNVSAQSGVTVTNVGTSGKNITLASTLRSSGEVSFGKYSASAVLQLTIP